MRKNYIISRDEITPYVPEKPKFVVLGTMASVNARRIDTLEPPTPPLFYYHNNANRFWTYMWQLFEGKDRPKELTVSQKQAACEDWGMAICNVVKEMQIPETEAKNRLDDIIFEAEEQNKLKLKKVNEEFRNCLKSLPTFFTRYSHTDKRLEPLLRRFYSENNLSPDLVERINFMHTPAMGSPKRALPVWQNAMKDLIG